MFVLAAAAVHAPESGGSLADRCWSPALAGWLIAVVAIRTVGSTVTTPTGSPTPALAVTAGPAVRRVRQRHPSAAAVAGVLLCRHRARPAARYPLVASGGGGHRIRALRRLRSSRTRPRRASARTRSCSATTRSNAASSTPRARSAPRCSPSSRSRGSPTDSSRPAIVDTLRRAGQMSLTIYLAHALVFNLVVDWLEMIDAGEASAPRSRARADLLGRRHDARGARTSAASGAARPRRLYRRLTA